MTVDSLKKRPWRQSGFLKWPSSINRVKGMLGTPERRVLYWIGRHYFDGSGLIVDAGAYVGGSALCIAAGLAAQKRLRPAEPLIYSYDFFRAMDAYVAEDITRSFDRPFAIGDDYLHLFLEQVKSVSHLIKPIQGDFLDAGWGDRPIELLFIDVAKTQPLNSHVIREFFPKLIPGRSLVIHQDFYHVWHPYIHVTMEMLSPYFEVIDGHIDYQSRLYLYTKAIPQRLIDEVAAYQFSADDRLAALDAFAARETGDMRAMADAIKLCQFAEDGDVEGVRRQYKGFLARYGERSPKGLWWRQAGEIVAGWESYLEPESPA